MTAPGGVIATVYVRVLPRIETFATDLRKGLKETSSQLRGIDRQLEPVTRALRNIGLTATGIVPGIQLTSASLKALGAQAVVGGLLSTAGALTTLSGALVALPAVGTAAASVLGTLTVGLFGVEDALKKFANEEKFNAKLELLSKNAQSALGVINEFRTELTAFRDSVQDRLFAGLDDVARGLIETFLPRLTTHFGNLADAINASVKDLAGFAQTADTLRDVDTVTGNVESAFVILRQALIPAATALRDVVTVGSQFLPLIALEVTKIVQRFAEWIAQLRATGQLQEFIARGLEALRQVGRIVGNIGTSLRGLLVAAQESGNGLLDTLEKLTGKLSELINSTSGQIAIKAFLNSAREAAQALTPVIVALVDLFFNSVFPVFERFATAVGPAVAAFFSGLGDALDVAAPGIEAFAGGFALFVQAIIPVLPLIGQLIGQIGVLVAVLAAKLGPVVAEIVTAIGNVLVPILDALLGIVLLLSPEFLKLVVIIGTVIAVVAALITVVRGVEAVIGLFAGGLQLLAGGLGKTRGAATGLVGFLSGPWGVALGIASIALGLFLSKSDNTTSSVNGLADAMINAADSTERATREWVRQQLESEGVAAVAERIGVSITDLTDAYLGNEVAIRKVSQALVTAVDKGDLTIDELDKLFEVVGKGPEVYKQAQEAVERKNQADASSVSILTSLNGLLEAQRAGLALVRDELDKQQAAQLAALNSDLAYRQQLTTTTAALAASTGTLDINTAEGQENLKTLSSLALAGQRRVADLEAQNASTAAVNGLMAENRAAIIALVQPYFDSAAAAEAFAVEIGLIPRSPTVTPVFDDTAARKAAHDFGVIVDYETRDRLLTIRFNPTGNAQAALGLPTGGFQIPGLAAGGTTPAGQWRWVGEKGPELVRFGSSARVYPNDESMDIARDVGALEGMTRSGGYGASQTWSSTGGGSTTVDNRITVQPTVKVYVDGQELRGLVRVELDQRDRQLRRLITTGAGTRGN